MSAHQKETKLITRQNRVQVKDFFERERAKDHSISRFPPEDYRKSYIILE